MATKIRLRRGLASEWTAANPILGLGEVGLELDTKNLKVGDGLLSWNSLDYYLGYTNTEIDNLLLNKADVSDLSLKVDKITPITSATYRRPVFTVNSQGQITSIREKILQYSDSNTDATNNTAIFANFLTININPTETADFNIRFVALYSNSTTNASPLIDVLVDGVGLYDPDFASHEEVSDSTASERLLRSGFDIKTLAAGSHTIQLVFRPETAGTTMTMRYGSLLVEEL